MMAPMFGGSEVENPRAWSIIIMGGEQQYAGHEGYADDPRRAYLYDSHVGNHLNLKKRDEAIAAKRAIRVQGL